MQERKQARPRQEDIIFRCALHAQSVQLGGRCAGVENLDLVIDPSARCAAMGQDVDLVCACLTIDHQAIPWRLCRQADDVNHIGVLTTEDGGIRVQAFKVEEKQVVFSCAQIEGGCFSLDSRQANTQIIRRITGPNIQQVRCGNQTLFNPDTIRPTSRIEVNVPRTDQSAVKNINLICTVAQLDQYTFLTCLQARRVKVHTGCRIARIADLQSGGCNERARHNQGILDGVIRAKINGHRLLAALQTTCSGDLDRVAATIGFNTHNTCQCPHERVELQHIRASPGGDHHISRGFSQRIERHQQGACTGIGNDDIPPCGEHIFDGQCGLARGNRPQIKADITCLCGHCAQGCDVILTRSGLNGDIGARKNCITQDDLVIARACADQNERVSCDCARDIDERIAKGGFQKADGCARGDIPQHTHAFQGSGHPSSQIETNQTCGAGHIAIKKNAVCAATHIDDERIGRAIDQGVACQNISRHMQRIIARAGLYQDIAPCGNITIRQGRCEQAPLDQDVGTCCARREQGDIETCGDIPLDDLKPLATKEATCAQIDSDRAREGKHFIRHTDLVRASIRGDLNVPPCIEGLAEVEIVIPIRGINQDITPCDHILNDINCGIPIERRKNNHVNAGIDPTFFEDQGLHATIAGIAEIDRHRSFTCKERVKRGIRLAVKRQCAADIDRVFAAPVFNGHVPTRIDGAFSDKAVVTTTGPERKITPCHEITRLAGCRDQGASIIGIICNISKFPLRREAGGEILFGQSGKIKSLSGKANIGIDDGLAIELKQDLIPVLHKNGLRGIKLQGIEPVERIDLDAFQEACGLFGEDQAISTVINIRNFERAWAAGAPG